MTAAIIDWINASSDALVSTLVRASWQGGIALLLAAALCALVARRGSTGRLQSWLWRLAHLKLLVCLLGVAPVTLALLPAAPPVGDPRSGTAGAVADAATIVADVQPVAFDHAPD